MSKVREILQKLVRRLLVNGSNHSDNLIGQAEAELLSIDNEEIERLSNEAKLWKTEWEQITETARQMQVRIKVLEEALDNITIGEQTIGKGISRGWRISRPTYEHLCQEIEKMWRLAKKALEPLPSAPKKGN